MPVDRRLLLIGKGLVATAGCCEEGSNVPSCLCSLAKLMLSCTLALLRAQGVPAEAVQREHRHRAKLRSCCFKLGKVIELALLQCCVKPLIVVLPLNALDVVLP